MIDSSFHVKGIVVYSFFPLNIACRKSTILLILRPSAAVEKKRAMSKPRERLKDD